MYKMGAGIRQHEAGSRHCIIHIEVYYRLGEESYYPNVFNILWGYKRLNSNYSRFRVFVIKFKLWGGGSLVYVIMEGLGDCASVLQNSNYDEKWVASII